MINVQQLTNYNRTQEELEELLLFTIAVAGKNASLTARNIETFLSRKYNIESPFQYVLRMAGCGKLRDRLFEARLGKYNLLGKGFVFAAKKCYRGKSGFNLKACSIEQLEEIPGIGPKSARMFVLHTRPNQKIAVLDVHILRFMREEWGILTPRSTPTRNRYRILEQEFLNHCEKTETYHKKYLTLKDGSNIPLKIKNKQLDIAAFDLEVWKHYRVDLTRSKQ